MKTSSSLFLILAATLTLPAFAAENLEERRIEGKDATFLAAAMKESGATREAFVPDGTPSDHPEVKAGEFVYRMESVVCREKKCEPFKVSDEKMKKIEVVLRKLGVKETKPPALPKGKREKPFLFIQQLLCGAEKEEGAATACLVTAHMNPRKK